MIKRLLQLRIVLLIISGLIASWFVVQAAQKSFIYIRLDSRITAQSVKWEIKMLSPSKYALLATYHYHVEGQDLTERTLFSSPNYLNYYAAENDLKTKQGNEYAVWYQKKNPAFSSLQKQFPKKECTNAFLTLGVFIYFYFARGLLGRVVN